MMLRHMWGTRLGRHSILVAGVMAVSVAGCGSLAQRTFEPGVEHRPGPASVWLTSDPETPRVPVLVTMTQPGNPGVLLEHTFVPGSTLRGSFVTSEGGFRLAALGGACSLDLTLGASEIAEVVLTLGGPSGCSLAVVRVGSIDDPAMQKVGPAVLITNHGAGDATPFEEPGPGSP